MFKKIFNYYCSVPLFLKMAIAFILGIIGGIVLFKLGESCSSAWAEKSFRSLHRSALYWFRC